LFATGSYRFNRIRICHYAYNAVVDLAHKQYLYRVLTTTLTIQDFNKLRYPNRGKTCPEELYSSVGGDSYNILHANSLLNKD